MERWERPLRGLIYGLALLPLLAAEALFVLLPDFVPAPALLPLAVAAVAALSGPEAGAGYGLYAGFFYGLQQPEALGLPLSLFALTLLGFLGGSLRTRLPKGFSGAWLLALSLLLALLLPRALWWMLAAPSAAGAAFALVGGELFCSLLAFPPVFWLYSACRAGTKHLRPAAQAEL